METLTIELRNPKAKKLIDDLIDLELISVVNPATNWQLLWNKLDNLLPQTEPDLTESEIMDEIKAYRSEKRNS
jgi:hypothetical protein